MTDKVAEVQDRLNAKDTEKEVITKNDDKPLNPEWETRQHWEAETSLRLRKEYETLLIIWKQTELQELDKKNEDTIKLGLEEYYKKAQEQQKPPSDEDIEKLLNQEYKEFNIRVDYVDGEDTRSEQFVIRELPQASEKRFFKHFREKIMVNAQALESLVQETIDQPFEAKAKAFMDLFYESFDILAEAVVIILNPFNKKTFVTREWVQNNIGSDRQWNIVEAQIGVNRLKDFFSRVSQSGLMTQTAMTGQRFQQLQQLVR